MTSQQNTECFDIDRVLVKSIIEYYSHTSVTYPFKLVFSFWKWKLQKSLISGVIIDNKLCWKSHIDHVKTKMPKTIAIVNKSIDVLNKKKKKEIIIYTTLYTHDNSRGRRFALCCAFRSKMKCLESVQTYYNKSNKTLLFHQERMCCKNIFIIKKI